MAGGASSTSVPNLAGLQASEPQPATPTQESPLAACVGPALVPLRSFSMPSSYNFSGLPPVVLQGEFALGLDMDGVLLNDANYHELVAQVLCHRYHVDIHLNDIRSARKSGVDIWDFAMERVWETHDVPDNELRRQLREIEKYSQGHLRDRVLICPAALEWLQQLPLKVFIATNRSNDPALQGLIELGLDRLLPALFCQDDTHRIKPEADMIVSAARTLSITERVIFLDDSAVNQSKMATNSAAHGIEMLKFGILPPGYGYSYKLEGSLRKAGALAVMPSINHFLKDLALNMFGDVKTYRRIKESMRQHHAALELNKFGPKFMKQNRLARLGNP